MANLFEESIPYQGDPRRPFAIARRILTSHGFSITRDDPSFLILLAPPIRGRVRDPLAFAASIQVRLHAECLSLVADLTPLGRFIRWLRWFPSCLLVAVVLAVTGFSPLWLTVAAVQALLLFLVTTGVAANLSRQSFTALRVLMSDMQGS